MRPSKLFVDPHHSMHRVRANRLIQVVKAAHEAGLQVVAHTGSYELYAQAARTGIDIITRAPIDRALDDAVMNNITTSDIKVVPTLLMMKVRNVP